jgi:hypothetical protein
VLLTAGVSIELVLGSHLFALACSVFRSGQQVEELFGCLLCSWGDIACRTGGTDGVDGGARCRSGEQGVEVAEILLEFAELAGIDGWSVIIDTEGELRFLLFELTFEDLASTGDSVALVIEEGFDAECHLDVATTVEALAGTAFVGLELGELALPEAEDVGGDLAQPGYLADAEVELVRDV